jgi:hypothetical protein
MPGFWVWRFGVNTLIANWRWRDYLLVLGGRKHLLLAIIGPGGVVALRNRLLGRAWRTSK